MPDFSLGYLMHYLLIKYVATKAGGLPGFDTLLNIDEVLLITELSVTNYRVKCY